jgi:transcriptional regulator with XRE-family HTH domain
MTPYAGEVNSFEPNQARVIPLRPMVREPLWRHVVGDVLRRERLAQERTLKDVADAARISMPYLSEVERGRKEASSEVLAAAARALGLGLADLLVLSQDELARLTQTRSASEKAIRAASLSVSGGTGAGAGVRTASRRAEMCLAA